jgi:hypothetical protein
VLSICTTSLSFNNSTFCPHSAFVCFMWICEQTAIISLHSINWLHFVTETECIYCTVRTGSLYVIHVHPLMSIGHYMYHQFNIHNFYVLPIECIDVFCVYLRTNSDYFPIQHELTGFITETECVYCAVWAVSSIPINVSIWPVRSTNFHQRSVLLFTYVLLWTEGRRGECWEPSKPESIQLTSTFTLLVFRELHWCFA